MIPYFVIAAITLLGGVFGGFLGALVGLAISIAGMFLLSHLLVATNGGLIPRNVRDKTATDFMFSFPELVAKAYPDILPSEAKVKVENLLEEMAVSAAKNSSSMHLGASGRLGEFAPIAFQVAMLKPNQDERTMAVALAEFLMVHPLWYGRA